jgi:hypothetical protein
MCSARLPLLALAAAVSVAGSNRVHADTLSAPFVPPAPLTSDVPHEVSVAVVALRQACASWGPATTTAAPGVAGTAPRPLTAPSPALPERTLCEVAENPHQAFLQPMLWSGIAGAVLFFIGLLVFSLLRGMLISVWNWRLPIGAKSW